MILKKIEDKDKKSVDIPTMSLVKGNEKVLKERTGIKILTPNKLLAQKN